MKRLPKGQWSLQDCLDYIDRNLSEEDAEFLATASNLKMNTYGVRVAFGRWIRNQCGLWTEGTDRLAHDIVEGYKRGEIRSEYLDEGTFHHQDLPFDLKNTKGSGLMWEATKKEKGVMNTKQVRVDCSLLHPDNCSAVVMEIVIRKLRDERSRDTTNST